MSNVVISYRREDSLKYTERLYDRIRVEFGEGNVFRDLDSISFGKDFRETIDKVLSNASVLLAVIGPGWVDARDDRGNRRLDNPFDFVRVEIARALVRKVRVIPVLVGGASMPTLEEVPEELKPLLPRQAFPLLDRRFNQDLEKLTSIMDEIRGPKSEEKRSTADQSAAEVERLQRLLVEQKEQSTAEWHRRLLEQERQSKTVARRRLIITTVLVLLTGILAAYGAIALKPATQTLRERVDTLETTLAQAKKENETTNVQLQTTQAEREKALKEALIKNREKGRLDIPPGMVMIPAGTFQMGDIQGRGDKDEQPIRKEVRFAKPFAVGRYEVTFEEYDRFAKATRRELPDDVGWGRGRRPVINVSWVNAVAYARWLSQQTGKRYRLPTEAEWEYAARAGSKTAYWWGDRVEQGMANCDGCEGDWEGKAEGKRTAQVDDKNFAANDFGLYHTAGNVWEWVEDCWHENYEGAPNDGTVWEKEGGGDCGQRVLRGGSWIGVPWFVRSSFRNWYFPSYRLHAIGFRLAQDTD